MEDKIKDVFEFKAGEPSDINDDKITLCPQALDNQWVPKTFLAEMAKKSLRRIDRLREINQCARREYINALLSGNRVVINRAFFVNSATEK